jgi:galactose-1-phosphate uridylyltransferase
MAEADHSLRFETQTVTANIRDTQGNEMVRPIEVRIHPITGRMCRITFSRSQEYEPGAETLPPPPPDVQGGKRCPFCSDNLENCTPRTRAGLDRAGRLRYGGSTLFPNLFPYGACSAVSLFHDRHFVEIGKADADSYTDSFVNCAQYLNKVVEFDPEAQYMAITQNHLPAAGGSLVHPHLQVHADGIPSNHHAALMDRARAYNRQTGRLLFSDYLNAEQDDGHRIIGVTGPWQWLATFAPEGFFEIWAIYPGKTSFFQLETADWKDLSQGVINTQRFYRSICRNSYNLGLLAVEQPQSCLELRVVMIVRANYAPWVRNDITGYEVMLGDMATFSAPEETAESARPFWHG